METGIAWPFVAIQITNLAVAILWIVLMIVAFWQLRQRQLGDLTHVLWVILIIFVPLLGALAFLITQPGGATQAGPSHLHGTSIQSDRERAS
jgi:hypothetical protein